MKNKTLLIIILSILFVVIATISLFLAFPLNNIETEFSVYENSEEKVEDVKEKLNKFIGNNLIFLNENDIKKVVEENPYFVCESVEKKFPSSVKISVKERRGVYVLAKDDNNYLADENGLVLSLYEGNVEDRKYIQLKFSDIDYNVTVGEIISFGDNVANENAFLLALDTAKEVNLTDCIAVMTIENKTVQYHIVFDTYTKVKIRIMDAGVSGVLKGVKGFECYTAETNDKRKSDNEIQVYLDNEGVINAVWTRH